MIAALIALLFMGGSSPLLENIDVYQDRTKTVITDEVRQDKAKAVLKSMEKRVKSQNKIRKDIGDQLGDLLEDQAVADAQLDAVWDTYADETKAYDSDMLDLRFELKQHVQREEWVAIFADPKKKL